MTVRYVEGSTGASVRETVASVLLLDHVEDIKDTHGDYSAEVHLFPFRTEKLSPAAPMILHESCGKVGRRHPHNGSLSIALGLFCFVIVSRSSETLLSPHAFFLPHGSDGWTRIF